MKLWLITLWIVTCSLCVVHVQAAPGAKPKPKPNTSTQQRPSRTKVVNKLRIVAHNASRQLARDSARTTRLERRVQEASVVESGARRSYETLRDTRGARSPEARSARLTFDQSRATRANTQLSLDSARAQKTETKRRAGEANRALSLARKGDWEGFKRADGRLNSKPVPRARTIIFAPTVQVREVSMAPAVVAARKGELKPKKR